MRSQFQRDRSPSLPWWESMAAGRNDIRTALSSHLKSQAGSRKQTGNGACSEILKPTRSGVCPPARSHPPEPPQTIPSTGTKYPNTRDYREHLSFKLPQYGWNLIRYGVWAADCVCIIYVLFCMWCVYLCVSLHVCLCMFLCKCACMCVFLYMCVCLGGGLIATITQSRWAGWSRKSMNHHIQGLQKQLESWGLTKTQASNQQLLIFC